MRFYESRQSGTSPIRYRLELSLEELKKVSTHLAEILCALKEKDDDIKNKQSDE